MLRKKYRLDNVHRDTFACNKLIETTLQRILSNIYFSNKEKRQRQRQTYLQHATKQSRTFRLDSHLPREQDFPILNYVSDDNGKQLF